MRSMLTWLSLALLAPPAFFMARWICIFTDVSGHTERVAAFGAIFPRGLQDPVMSTLVALAIAIAALVVGLAGLVVVTGVQRWSCGAVATLSMGLARWLAWTLL